LISFSFSSFLPGLSNQIILFGLVKYQFQNKNKYSAFFMAFRCFAGGVSVVGGVAVWL
jgi:hypothetical protein